MENSKEFYLIVKGKKIIVSEEVYRAYVRPVRAEQRAKRRERKCRIVGEKGNLVRCPYNCEECEYAASGKKAQGSFLSLDGLIDEGFDVPDKNTDVEQEYIDCEERKEDAEKIHNAIATLTPRQQEIIRLIYFEEKTQEEVAAILSISRNTVKTIYERTMVKLKKYFKKF